AELAPLTLPDPDPELDPGELHARVLAALAAGGAFFFRPLSDAVGGPDDADLVAALWELTWAGHLTNDTLAPLRSRLAGGRAAHRVRPIPGAVHGRDLPVRAGRSVARGPPAVTGRAAGGGRAVVAAARARDGPHPARARPGRGAARAVRRGDPGRGRRRAGA